MSIPANPNDHQLSADELLKLFTPDINRDVDGDKIDNLPQVLRNVGSIIAVEARRAFEFFKHPFDTGFLTNRKILERLEGMKHRGDTAITNLFVDSLEGKINKSDTKYEKNHRKGDIIGRIDALKDKQRISETERLPKERGTLPPQPKGQWNKGVADPTQPRTFSRDAQRRIPADQEEDSEHSESETDTLPDREGYIPPRAEHATAEESSEESTSEGDETSNSDVVPLTRWQWQWGEGLIKGKRAVDPSFLDASFSYVGERGQPLPESLPKNVQRIQSPAQTNVATEESRMFSLRLEYLEVLKGNFVKFIRSDVVQKAVEKLDSGTATIELDDMYLGRLLEGLPEKLKAEVGKHFKPLILQIVKQNEHVKYFLPQTEKPEFRELLPTFDFHGQFAVIQDAERVTTVGWPNVRFGGVELRQLINNINQFLLTEDTKKAFRRLQQEDIQLKLNEFQIEKLVTGLPKETADGIAQWLQNQIIRISQTRSGVLFTLYEQASRARLGSSFLYNQETPELLATTLSDALTRLLPESNPTPLQSEVSRRIRQLDGIGSRRESLLRELQGENLTPARIREIRRELIGLYRHLERSLTVLQNHLPSPQESVTDLENRENGRAIARMAMELRSLRRALFPEHMGLIQQPVIAARTESPISQEAFEPIRMGINAMIARKNQLLAELNAPGLGVKRRNEIASTLRTLIQEGIKKQELYAPQFSAFMEDASIGQQAEISRVFNSIERAIKDINLALQRDEIEPSQVVPEPVAEMQVRMDESLPEITVLEKLEKDLQVVKDKRAELMGTWRSEFLPREERENVLQSLKRLTRDLDIKHKSYQKEYDKLWKEEKFDEANRMVDAIGELKELSRSVVQDARTLENSMRGMQRLSPGPSETPGQETKAEDAGLPEKLTRVSGKKQATASRSIRPSLAMLALITLTMLVRNKFAMGGEEVSNSLTTPTFDVFPEYVPIADLQFGTGTYNFVSEDNRGYPPYAAEESSGFKSLLEDFNNDDYQKSVRAANVMADTALTPTMRREAIARLFDNEANFQYFYWLTERLIGQAAFGDKIALAELKQTVDKCKEALLDRQNNHYTKEHAARVLNKIAEKGQFVSEIISIPSPLLYGALDREYSTVAGYKIIKREIEKGENSYFNEIQRGNWQNFVYLTDMAYNRFNRGLSTRTPGENVEEIFQIMIESIKTYEIDLEFGYPHIFENEEATQYFRETCTRILNTYFSNDYLKTENWKNRMILKSGFELAKYGVLTHPEAKGPREIISLYASKGVFTDEIQKDNLLS